MKAAFQINDRHLRAELTTLVQQYQEDMRPLDDDGRPQALPPCTNPCQYIYWAGNLLVIEGHRHALWSEGVSVMRALREAEKCGQVKLVSYETSVPGMYWHEVMEEYILRQPLAERVTWYAEKGIYKTYFDRVFPELLGLEKVSPSKLWASFPASDVRLFLRAFRLRQLELEQ